jgi:hypothetical protein
MGDKACRLVGRKGQSVVLAVNLLTILDEIKRSMGLGLDGYNICFSLSWMH